MRNSPPKIDFLVRGVDTEILSTIMETCIEEDIAVFIATEVSEWT